MRPVVPRLETLRPSLPWSDPLAVARAWAKEYCTWSYRQPRNDFLRRAGRFQGTEGRLTDASVQSDSAASYADAQRQRLGGSCTDLRAVYANGYPSVRQHFRVVVVAISWTQITNRAGVPTLRRSHGEDRYVVRGADGRWLVGQSETDAG